MPEVPDKPLEVRSRKPALEAPKEEQSANGPELAEKAISNERWRESDTVVPSPCSDTFTRIKVEDLCWRPKKMLLRVLFQ